MRFDSIFLILLPLIAADPVSDLVHNFPANSFVNTESLSVWLESYTSLVEMHYKTKYSDCMMTGDSTKSMDTAMAYSTSDYHNNMHSSEEYWRSTATASVMPSTYSGHGSRDSFTIGASLAGISALLL